MVRTLIVGAAVLLVSAGAAGAQITTYVAPPTPAAETKQALAAADSARRDSVAQSTMANMKAWVDSAAGVTVPNTVGDTAGDPGRPVSTFEDGAVAPATASPLPSMILLGAASLVVGAGLLATRPRR